MKASVSREANDVNIGTVGGYRKLSVLLFCTTVIFALLFMILWIREDYTKRVLQKLDIVSTYNDDQREDYWTCFSWKSCLEQLDIDADIVFFGDSITRGGDFQNAFDSYTIVNLGISGDSIDGMYKRIDMIGAVNPEKIFIEGGINGLSAYGVDSTIESYERLLTGIIEDYPDAEIYVQGILPINESLNDNSNDEIRAADVSIEKLCSELGVTYIDLFDLFLDDDGQLPESNTVDGVHLTNEAYEIWFEYIRTYIYE